MARALVIVDIQDDYFPGGKFPLVGPDAAAERAASLLEAFRAAGETVVHVRHVWDEPDAAFMKPGTPGIEINAAVAPLPGELVISKEHPNAFLETELERTLRDVGVEQLVVCGMMTSMCVDATVRAAADLGFDVSVAHDACAAPDLQFGDRRVAAADVHAAFLAALGSSYARVAAADELLAP
ncbi:MAG TPA: cysteine hydrolase family protein [Gaiellaceae bacterium]|nr:cysteine hydrolase family protein [Gaiellaceae bacterium]